MNNNNELLIKTVAESLNIKSDKLAKILRDNKDYIFGLFKKIDTYSLGSVYEVLRKALFIRGVKSKGGEEIKVEVLTTQLARIRKETI